MRIPPLQIKIPNPEAVGFRLTYGSRPEVDPRLMDSGPIFFLYTKSPIFMKLSPSFGSPNAPVTLEGYLSYYIYTHCL